MRYVDGDDVERELNQAAKWLQKPARQGMVEARSQLMGGLRGDEARDVEIQACLYIACIRDRADVASGMQGAVCLRLCGCRINMHMCLDTCSSTI